jgi:hypothetical protein
MVFGTPDRPAFHGKDEWRHIRSATSNGHWIPAEGEETDVVILILGGDPDQPGARRFATREPNLLNVAVTRAKRRLYVIGNRDTWGNEPYFNVLAASIPRRVPIV